ncbi:MAG: septation protein A [Gallionellaceae bacterium]|jgi:intracellular septation protein|nr:septation protein A [Gallionellaceae bacterium]
MKFLFDLFPVLLFFVTYKIASHGKPDNAACLIGAADSPASILHEPILIATVVTIVATFLQVAWLHWRKKPVEKMLWASLAIVTVFGGATLYFRDPVFIQWKPTILDWVIGGFLLASTVFFKKNLIQESMQEQIQLPAPVWVRLNASWIIFFVAMGCANLVAVHYLSCAGWVNFKVYGLIGLTFIFVILQTLTISKYIIEDPKEDH